MAKDAKGHGSEARAVAVQQGRALASHQIKIQRLDTSLIGTPWRTVGGAARRAVAERTARNMRVDDRDALLRIR